MKVITCMRYNFNIEQNCLITNSEYLFYIPFRILSNIEFDGYSGHVSCLCTCIAYPVWDIKQEIVSYSKKYPKTFILNIACSG
jgi:hypothetical protein